MERMEEVGKNRTNEKKLVWFAMSAPYSKELEAQQLLEKEDIEKMKEAYNYLYSELDEAKKPYNPWFSRRDPG